MRHLLVINEALAKAGDAARAENTRLRAALELIERSPDGTDSVIAQLALKGQS